MTEHPQVFLSYNSRDRDTVCQIAARLRDRSIEVWLDADELRPGLPWQPELAKCISNAQSVAVLIGPNGAGPWQHEEIQEALRQAVRDGLPVIPVLLPGVEGNPDLPAFLPLRTYVDLRDGITDEGIGRLSWGITGRRVQDAPERHRTPKRHAGISERRVITIRLDHAPDGSRVKASYYESASDCFDRSTYDDAVWLSALERTTVEPKRLSRESHQGVTLRRTLFDVLFPNDAWQACAQRFRDRPELPPQQGVRLRIVTASPVLARLAWFATTWTDPHSPAGTPFPLAKAGWTFEVGAREKPGHHSLVLPAPCRVLVAKSSLEASPNAPIPTEADIRGALARWSSARAKPEYFAVATDPRGLQAQIENFHPHLVLYNGACELDPAGQPCIRLASGEPILLPDLVEICLNRPRPPMLVYLGLEDSAPTATLDHAIFKTLPAVVVDRGLAPATMTERALRFLEFVLNEGADPATALRQVTEQFDFQSAGTCQLFSNYDHWETQIPIDSSNFPRRGPMELDRWIQRALVRDRINKLVDNGHVAAIVAYGEPGNHVDWFSQQALSCLDEPQSRVCSRPLELDLLNVAQNNPYTSLSHALERQLRSELQIESSDSLAIALRKYALDRTVPNRTPLIWLNWGTISNFEQEQTREILCQWLNFCAHLTTQCDRAIRIASYVAMEAKAAHHDDFLEALTDCSLPLLDLYPTFDYVQLERLKQVSYKELLDFLRDQRNSGCPDAAHFAKRLHEIAKGHYAELVHWIHRAEVVGWDRVRRELDRPWPPAKLCQP